MKAQVAAVAANPFVRDAWRRGQPLSVHGWIYSVQDGLLRDLETSVGGAAAAQRLVTGAARRPPRPRVGRYR